MPKSIPDLRAAQTLERIEKMMVPLHLRIDPEDASLIDILDRIMDKGIVLDPWVRVMLGAANLRKMDNRIVLAPERRRRPFLLPKRFGQALKPRS
jgi:Gas vesicle protein